MRLLLSLHQSSVYACTNIWGLRNCVLVDCNIQSQSDTLVSVPSSQKCKDLYTMHQFSFLSLQQTFTLCIRLRYVPTECIDLDIKCHANTIMTQNNLRLGHNWNIRIWQIYFIHLMPRGNWPGHRCVHEGRFF